MCYEQIQIQIILQIFFRLEAVRVEMSAGLKNIANTLMAKGKIYIFISANVNENMWGGFK